MQMQELIAGTSLNFLTAGGAYPASSGWVLTYRLVRRGGVGAITLTASAEGADYRVTASAATTASWAADTYSWESRVSKAGEVYRIASGQIVIQPDIGTATGSFDNRSPTEIALDNVRAMLQGKASSATRRYRIGDRELESYGIAELIQLESRLAMEFKRERRKTAIELGLPDPNKTYVRLNRE